MADSIVSKSEIRAFKAAIQSYSTGSENILRQFDLQIRPIMRRFEEKLDMLEEIRNEKYRALSSCHERQKYNDDISCSSQEREFAIASGRYHECLGLIREARAAIQQFRLKSEAYRSTTADLVSRAKSGLDRVEDMISKYSSQTDATTTAISEAGPILSSSGMESAIHISGGDRIASVISRSTGKSTIVIDPEARAHKLDNLPPVSKPDHQEIHSEAKSIFGILCAGGIVIGLSDLLQQRANVIFEKQYGISSTELLLASGSKANEYVNAYNNIYGELKQEVVEVQKEDIRNKIAAIDSNLKILKSRQDNFWSIEQSVRLETDRQNLENDLAAFEGGKKKGHIPYDQTVVAGLSSKGLEYMMGQMSPGRFATVCTYLADSDYRLVENGTVSGFYQFTDNVYNVGISKDGKTLTIERATSGNNLDIDGLNVNVQGEHSINGEMNKDRKGSTYSESAIAMNMTYTPVKAGMDLMNYERQTLYISEDGGLLSNIGLHSRIGPNASVTAGGSAYIAKRESADIAKRGIEVALKAEASLAESSLSLNIYEQPFIHDGKIVLIGAEISGGGNLGGEIVGNYEVSKNGLGGKLKASAGLSGEISGRIKYISLEDLPESVAEHLSKSLPGPDDVVIKKAWESLIFASDPHNERVHLSKL